MNLWRDVHKDLIEPVDRHWLVRQADNEMILGNSVGHLFTRLVAGRAGRKDGGRGCTGRRQHGIPGCVGLFWHLGRLNGRICRVFRTLTLRS